MFFSTINRNAKAFLFAIVGAEYVLKLLPKGTHEYAQFIRPSELARWCRDAGLERWSDARHGIQPADAALLAVRRHQRQLPGGVPQAGMTRRDRAVAAVLFDLDGTLIDSAPDLAGAGNDMRADARPARRCRYERCARWSARARAAWSASPSASRRATPASRRCATSSWRATRRA